MGNYYNGWSKRERMATLPLLRAAIRSGAIPAPSRCSICGFVNADDPTGRNYVQCHDERYDVIEPYEVCKRCHIAIHRRFERPLAWQKLLKSVWVQSEWFNLLSLDPASQFRPFEETYPKALPRPDWIG